MGERQVTVGRQTYALPSLFLVMATQNPIEQEGTFPLPEAQLDRFLMYVRIGYPAADAEGEILRLARERARQGLQVEAAAAERISQDDVFAARAAVLDLHLAPQLERYLRSEEHTSELQSLMRISYAVFCLKKKNIST